MLHKIKHNEFKRATRRLNSISVMPVFSFGVGQVIGKNQRPNAHSLNCFGHLKVKNRDTNADFLLAGQYMYKNHSSLARLNFPASVPLQTSKGVPDTFYLGHIKFGNHGRHAQVI